MLWVLNPTTGHFIIVHPGIAGRNAPIAPSSNLLEGLRVEAEVQRTATQQREVVHRFQEETPQLEELPSERLAPLRPHRRLRRVNLGLSLIHI